MGGRYGAADDGSSDYQDRRPSTDEREPEQQTVAEAVREVQQRQQSEWSEEDTATSTDREDQHSAHSGTRTANRRRARAGQIGTMTDRIVASMIDVDEAVADLVAEQLVEQIRKANEDELVDNDRHE